MVSISTELFFNEAEFRIIIPNYPKEAEQADPLALMEASPREFAFYGKERGALTLLVSTTNLFYYR